MYAAYATELAWAAGFFDGEGSIGRYAAGRLANGSIRRVTRMGVTQKDRRPLERFRQAVGAGRVYPKNGEPANGMHAWHAVAKSDVHRAIWLLWPWLSEPKREQIAGVC